MYQPASAAATKKQLKPIIVHAPLEDHTPGVAICSFNRDGTAHPSATAAMQSVK
jgi:hypothetical protein